MDKQKHISVEISERGGSYYATSKQVPGFILCADNVNALHADILPAMKLLLSVKEKHQQKPAHKSNGHSDRLVERRELLFA
jgi:hypothetical protein